jgi:hypothetical protein
MIRIAWTIDEAEWRSASKIVASNPAGSYFDSERLAFVTWFLWGALQFWDGDRPLFVPDLHAGQDDEEHKDSTTHLDNGFLLGDVAIQFAGIFDALRAQSGTKSVQYQQSDDSGTITFVHDHGMVRIESNSPWSNTFLIPGPEALGELSRFLQEFADECGQRLPQLLSWDTFLPIAQYASNVSLVPEMSTSDSQVYDRLPYLNHRLERSMAPREQQLLFSWDVDAVDWAAIQSAIRLNPPGSYLDCELTSSSPLFTAPARWLFLSRPVQLPAPLSAFQARVDAYASVIQKKRGLPSALKSQPTTLGLELALRSARWLDSSLFAQPSEVVVDKWLRLGLDVREWLAFGDVYLGVAGIRPTIFDELVVIAGESEVQSAVADFLSSFTESMMYRVPTLFSWHSFAPLRQYRALP